MGKRKDPKRLQKLLIYILERQPDEFGLVPDKDGFIRIKDVIKAVTEEPGWGYVRKSHLNEIMMTMRDRSLVIEDDRIRGRVVHESGGRTEDVIPPKILYHCVRRKAYPVVCEKGIMPMGQHHVFLCTEKEMALRIGKRRDPKPVLLTVQAYRASLQGVYFALQGETIYLVDHIPVGLFSGPPLPKETGKSEGKKKEKEPERESGTFAMDMERSEKLQRQKQQRKGRKKEIGWKKDARKMRRRKS